ncbi:hypothetical protein V5O48_005473 [Marasmius crinis-equi]|uniref:Uncharacterized protein n=1 Tax=Marasmius crinis-equi TaxID=585013 RepID=A0ABR3FM84_9AGAR
MSGLAPTLIIVRVAHGQTVDSVDQMVSSLRVVGGNIDEERSTMLEARISSSHPSSSPESWTVRRTF